jgi:Family of unknown function (DUF6325)
MRGPIDYIVVGFEGPKFDGSILEALTDAVDQGVIDIVAMSVIRKDQEGNVTTVEADEKTARYAVQFAERLGKGPAEADDADVAEVADLLQNDTAAGLLVIEHLWAKPLKQAILDAGGVLVAEGRIHPEAAAELG